MSDAAMTPEEVTYETFVNELLADKVSNVDLYTYGDLDLTYTNSDGVFRGASTTGSANDDDLLNQTLKAKSVSYIAHDSKYPGESQNDHSYMMWTSGLIFLIPIALVVVIIIQSKTNANLSAKIAEMACLNNK